MNRSVCSSRFKWSVAREIKFCYQTKNLKVSYWRGPAIRWVVRRDSISLVSKTGLRLEIAAK